ncbi:zinc finger protein 343-like, partial [Phyllostomus discolor]|uniref:Zinc finger protein 343-like n=1 Tax=Phyllostomus discolor TaxID=89673 RepID=A0A7E6CEB8_9CHIR
NNFYLGLLAEFRGKRCADSRTTTLPDRSASGEQGWEEILSLDHREDTQTMKKSTQSHQAKGVPSKDTDWPREREGKPKISLPVTFRDISVVFTKAEWRWLSPKQRSLYKEVMLENCRNLLALATP